LGAAAVGITDPISGGEELFLFGGRRQKQGVSNDTTTTTADGGDGGDDDGDDDGDGDESMDKSMYSDSIWRYSLSTDTWRCTRKGQRGGVGVTQLVDWPPGRAFHSMVYIRETESVLVIGGDLDGSDGIDDDDDDDDHVDVWFYHLRTNRWSKHHHHHSSHAASGVDRDGTSLLQHKDSHAPTARRSTSISLLRALPQRPPPPPSSSSPSPSSPPTSSSSISSSLSEYVVLFGGKLNAYKHRSSSSMMRRGRRMSPSIDRRGIDINRDAAVTTALDKNDLWLYSIVATEAAAEDREVVSLDASRVASMDRASSLITHDTDDDDDTIGQWLLLSSGGCYAFDDGKTHDPIDLVAMTVLLLIVASILVGMYCHRFTLPYRGPPLLHPPSLSSSSISSVRRYSSLPPSDED